MLRYKCIVALLITPCIALAASYPVTAAKGGFKSQGYDPTSYGAKRLWTDATETCADPPAKLNKIDGDLFALYGYSEFAYEIYHFGKLPAPKSGYAVAGKYSGWNGITPEIYVWDDTHWVYLGDPGTNTFRYNVTPYVGQEGTLVVLAVSQEPNPYIENAVRCDQLIVSYVD
jgi:hypothetical protein